MNCSKIGLPLPAGNWRGRVHSVFEHSFNVLTDENRPMLVIHSFSYIVPPGSFYIKDLDTGSIEAGTQVNGEDQRICIGGKSIWIEEKCQRIDTALPELENRGFLLDSYKMLLDERRKQQQAPLEMALQIYGCLNEGIGSFFKALKRQDKEMLRSAADQCIGLGFGLTPSGDDLLSGILAVLRCYDPSAFELAAEAVAAELNRTNDISKSYLIWACGGNASDVVIHTIQGLTDPKQQKEAGKLLQLGHTSGADILEGIIRAAEYLQAEPADSRKEYKL